MSVIVGVMDRAGFDANTDILALVEPEARRLLWVPRDLWCPGLADRINTAFRLGGHDRLVCGLAEHGLRVDFSLILAREATEAALAGARVLVPVPARMVFDYPLTPTARIEDGRKTIYFNPPAEVLRGERIHQWLGARAGSDLHRLERQKVFVRRLLEQGFDFRQFIANPAWHRCSDPAAFAALAQVRPNWRFETLGGLVPRLIGGKDVLVREPDP
jgi:hypothetical protein